MKRQRILKVGAAALAMVAGGLMAATTTSAQASCKNRYCNTSTGTCGNTDAKTNCGVPLPGQCYTGECQKT